MRRLEKCVLSSHFSVRGSFNGGHHIFHLRQGSSFQFCRVRHGDISTCHTFHGSIQVVECLRFHQNGSNFRPNTTLWPSLFQGNDTSGLFRRFNNRLAIQWTQGKQVDDFNGNTLGFHHGGGFQTQADRLGKGDKRHVGTGLFNLGLAKRNDKVRRLRFVAHGEGYTVHEFVFQHHDGVRITNGSLDESLGVFGRIGRNDLETRDTGIPSAKALRVLGSGTGRKTVGSTKDNGTGQITARHVELFGSAVDDLINGLHGKVNGHEFDNRSQVF
mmetsp:Transcript_20597/g.39095  ORF Transcript_20597/g.39095 Transcript_20597/m.39095 type:complete len:272 (+) Transcript_20597:99-914(+)